ncbi:MAG: tetratricopeptide repeat protein, partial [Ignavibacteriae bacterium]|nr:tetratricopeptide repeat protein [Ignavibacteriota bacterium]
MTTTILEPANIKSKIDELNKKAMAVVDSGNPEEALALSNEALDLSNTNRYRHGTARALWNKGWALCELLLFDDALDVLHESGDIFQEIGDSHGIARVLQGIGNVYFTTGRIQESLEEYLNAFAVLQLAGLERTSLGLLGNIAYSYKLLGEYFYAVEYSQKQLVLARSLNQDFYIAESLNSLGNSYFHIADYATSLNYYNEGLVIASREKDLNTESWIIGNIASVYLQLDNYTGALDLMMRSTAIAEQLKDQRHLAFCLNQICSIYRKMNNDSLALSYSMRSLSLYSALADKVGEANVLLNIARIFAQNGDAATALDYANKSYQLNHDTSAKEGEAESLLLIASSNEKFNNNESALEYAQKALEIAENINSHSILQSALKQLQSSSNLIGDSTASAHFSRRLSVTSKIIAKEEQRKNAEKLMIEAQLQKTRQHAEMLMASSNSSLSDDFLRRTDSIKQQGLVLATPAIPNASSKNKLIHPVIIETFGHFSVKIGNRELTTEDWQRKKARDIFKILLMNHRKSVSADELIDTLWYDAAGRNLIPTLWNCVTYIRKALEPDIMPRQPSVYIKIVGKNYMLDLGSNAEIDFLTFKELIVKAQKQTNESLKIQLYEQATALYSGDFLKEDSF